MGINASTSQVVATQTPGQMLTMGQRGIYGTGRVFVLYKSGAFKFPADVIKARITVVAGGGSGFSPGSTKTAGNPTSFGALLSATGGAAAVSSGSALGGTGTGGDFQASGGSASPGTSADRSGGGAAAGSQLGNGGNSANAGGAAVGGSDSAGKNGASAYGSSGYKGQGRNAAGNFKMCPDGALLRFPFDCFHGAGGAATEDPATGRSVNGGPGAGGSGDGVVNGYVGSGGDGGGGAGYNSTNYLPGNGGIGGGGGSYTGNGTVYSGGAGGGYATGEFFVTPSSTHMATVAAAAFPSGYPDSCGGGPGLIIVEC